MKRALGILLACWLSATAPAWAQSDLRAPEFMSEVHTGFDQIYNLDYRQAMETFEGLRAKRPRHPAPPLYLATAVWLRELFERQELDLDNFIAPSYFDKPTERKMPDADRRRFQSLIEESQQKAQAILELDPGNKDALYFLGSSHGILGSFAITIERSRTDAFREGKKAYQIHHDLVERDSAYYDAYMSVGVYEYIVGNLPWYVKWLAAIIGYRGSVERGLEYLQLAADRGQFVADDARTLQMVLLVREEQYEKALANVRHLERKAPKNFILKLNEAQILEKMGNRKQAVASYRELLEKAERGVPNFDRVPLVTMRYKIGRKLLELGEPESALAQFRRSLQDPATPERERALSRLLEGQALDLLGRREEAVSSYRKVLEAREVEGSHDQARRLLKSPFSQR